MSEDQRDIPVVNSFNEWDLLEEVIVGSVEGAVIPSWHVTLQATMPREHWDFFRRQGGKSFPPELIAAAEAELKEFVHILEAEGVRVRRGDPLDHSQAFKTPDWASAAGLYAAMPRDSLLVIGNQIIEAPMAWRSRYFETHSYRSLLKEYSQRGAKWVSAPKPQLRDELYNYDYTENEDERTFSSVITEFEPTFDAADFVRCGRDIFVQRSHVTNRFGIDWLRRYLGEEYMIHELDFNDLHPMHIDATFVPLAPGKLLVNPERVEAGSIPEMFKTWNIFYAPQPGSSSSRTLYMSSSWLTMNVLMLDEERVIVERSEETLIAKFRSWGFRPILCAFRNFNAFGGSFHCATLDIRRRGRLQSYF